mmetsp:Transcript_51100/g.59696  ORF Transcript_51100/g.59696 Transcript_51100/m.59696 type:complete len:100 (-) Transcript_51100:747-1046(-)
MDTYDQQVPKSNKGKEYERDGGGHAAHYNIVQFFDIHGQHLSTLRVPGSKELSDIAWEGNSIRFALTTGSSIFFATLRQDYCWSSIGSTIIYAHSKVMM